ncbi:hypothetical protein ILUMI_10145 [Ignelater luminosus]|uniref:Uncharacterized protein n=1 Tax=Ignelater luminosus TaxID=2038154 RepID=A0A8K0D4G7_IGNLU|nr:hypothetical protein ILUMI_10145 [Ignelater luminosus]
MKQMAKILALPKESKRRREAIQELTDFEELLPQLSGNKSKRTNLRCPSEKEKVNSSYTNYGSCPHSLGFMVKKRLWHHIKYNCKSTSKTIPDKQRRHIISESNALLQEDANILSDDVDAKTVTVSAAHNKDKKRVRDKRHACLKLNNDKYVIDEMDRAQNITVLKLSPPPNVVHLHGQHPDRSRVRCSVAQVLASNFKARFAPLPHPHPSLERRQVVGQLSNRSAEFSINSRSRRQARILPTGLPPT